MGDKTDEAKGRIKEAAGALTDDDSLKREGKVDKAAADVKVKVGDVVDTVKEKAEDVVDTVKEKAEDVVGRDRR